MLALAALFFAGIVAGFVNTVAGGGGLLTMPLLMAFGLPATDANGTARIAIVVQSLTAVWRFHRANAVDWSVARRGTAPVLIGALAGAYAGSLLPDASFRSVLGVAALVSGGIVAIDLPSRLGAKVTQPRPVALAVALLLCGFYGGMVQAGVGYLFLAALTLAGGLDLVSANVLKNLFICCYAPIALAVYAWGGHVDLAFGATLAAGQAIGAWLGAVETLRRGALLIRGALVVVLVATAAQLLVGLF